jgi:hypothetical protein
VPGLSCHDDPMVEVKPLSDRAASLDPLARSPAEPAWACLGGRLGLNQTPSKTDRSGSSESRIGEEAHSK